MDARPSIMEHVRIRPKFVDVEVLGILTKEGNPLTVRCRRPDPVELMRVVRATPGERPAQLAEQVVQDDEEEALLRLAPQLIERWASVQLPDGSWQCPAFSFAEETPPDLIPGSELTFADLSYLALAFLRIGGYLGGAAVESFSGQRGGSGSSNGAVAAG